MLEVEIEALTVAIERLTAQLQAQQPKTKESKPHLRMKPVLKIDSTASGLTKEAGVISPKVIELKETL